MIRNSWNSKKSTFQCFQISEIKSDFKSSNKENMPFEA